MSAVFVATAAFYAPESFGIGTRGDIHGGSLVEMSLGLAIGAVTFSGSVIAFAKLQALMSGAPITFPGQHWLNLGLGVLMVVLVVAFVSSGADSLFWLIALIAFALGFLLIIPIGGADMPVVVSMLNSYSGWAAAGIGFTLGNLLLIVTGALVGASGAILSYIMCKGMNRSVEAERLQLDRPVQADDADLREGDRVSELHRHAAIERRVGHGRGAGPGLRRRVPEHGGQRGQDVAGGVLAQGAVAAEAAQLRLAVAPRRVLAPGTPIPAPGPAGPAGSRPRRQPG